MNIEEMRKDYERLIDISNQHHNIVYEYIDKYGLDDKLVSILKGKSLWIQKILKEN
jgi:predicted O-methyltransferase YrrM